MALSSLSSTITSSGTFLPCASYIRTSSRTFLPFASYIRHENNPNKKESFRFPAASMASCQPVNVDFLEKEFSGHGVTFEAVGSGGGSCVAKMRLKNGSVATILLPSGLITSYKTLMWHGGTVELLHTAVSEGEYGDAVIQGGVSLNFSFRSVDDGEVSRPSADWVLHEIEGNSEESIQVKLVHRLSEENIGLKYIVTLEEDALISELEISNSKSLPLQMTGSILSHLTVSTPDAAYAVGLERSNYYSSPRFESQFFLRPPDSKQAEEGFGKIWKSTTLTQLIPRWGAKTHDGDQAKGIQRGGDEDMDGEEMDGYKHLRDNMSRIYRNAPRSFTVIDRGRRNSVSIGRNRFDEMYLYSPGSRLESYSKYSYIIVGQAAILKPIVIGPKDVWKGGQYIRNPNL